MKDVELAPSMCCPDCGRQMTPKVFLPSTDNLPGVAGYWCGECNKEVTIEIDDDPRT